MGADGEEDVACCPENTAGLEKDVCNGDCEGVGVWWWGVV